MARTPRNKIVRLVARGLCSFVVGACLASTASAQTGTTETIRNTAIVTANTVGGQVTTASNRSSTNVDVFASIEISPGQLALVLPAATYRYTHVIYNQGNFPDTYQVSVADDQSWLLDIAVLPDTTNMTGPDKRRTPTSNSRSGRTLETIRRSTNPLVSATSVNLGPLAPGDSAKVFLQVTVPPDAVIGQEDHVTLTVTSRRVLDETKSVIDTIRASDPRFDPSRLSVEPQGTVVPGTLLRYQFDFGNADPGTSIINVVFESKLESKWSSFERATSGTVQDIAVEGRVVDVVQSFDAGSKTVRWEIAELPPGFRGILQFFVRAKMDTPAGEEIENMVLMQGNGISPRTTNLVKNIVLAPLLEVQVRVLTPEIDAGDPVIHVVRLTNQSSKHSLEAVRVQFTLPKGFSFLDKVSQNTGKAGLEATRVHRQAVFSVAQIPAAGTMEWTLTSAASDRVSRGIYFAKATASAQILGRLELSAQADAPVRVRRALRLDGIVSGRVYLDDNKDGKPGINEGLPNVRILLEDGSQSMTDARGRYHLEAVRPGLHVVRIDRTGLPDDLEFRSEGRLAAGSDRTRFVDVQPGELRKVNFRATAPAPQKRMRYQIIVENNEYQFFDFSLFASDKATLRPEAQRMLTGLPRALDQEPAAGVQILNAQGKTYTKAKKLNEISRTLGLGITHEDTAPKRSPMNLSQRLREWSNDADIIHPVDGARATKDRIRVQVKFPTHTQPSLKVNGKLVSDELIGSRHELPVSNLSAYEYVGVPLRPGENRIEFEACDGEHRCQRQGITVWLAGEPAKIQVRVHPIPADGRTAAKVRVVLLDDTGRLVAHARYITLEVDGGITENDADPSQEGLQVRLQNGHAEVHLPPSSVAGERRIRAFFGDLVDEKILRFEPAPGDWIVAGVGEVGVSARPKDQPLTSDQISNGMSARGGLFAQGRLGPTAQLTVRYDSERDRQAFFGQEAREQLYPTLGDAASYESAAPSPWRLFARLDVPEGHAQLGDFSTGWTDVEFARFDRTLTGFDGTWFASAGDARAHFFLASSRQSAAQDEFPGRGTSGPFTLSQRPLLVNSESVYIEIRDRIHSEKIIESKTLRRYTHYTINYANGTIVLKEPLASANLDFHPIYLVVQYEILDQAEEKPLLGIHGSATFGNARTGLTAIREDTNAGTHTLLGTQSTWLLRSDMKLDVEYAHSQMFDRGNAFQVSLTSRGGPARQSRIYFRTVEPKFRNDSRTGRSELGTQKYGMEADVAAGENGQVLFDFFVQKDLSRDTERFGILTDYRTSFGPWQAGLGHRFTGERGLRTKTANVLAARTRRHLGKRFSLEAAVQKAVGDAQSNFPTRLTMGADAQIAQNVGVKVRQEWDGSDMGRSATLLSVDSHITKGTSITSRMEKVNGAVDDRAAAVVGLRTTTPLNRYWSLNAAAEQGRVFEGPSRDSNALSVGLQWQRSNQAASVQYEGRWTGAQKEHALRLSSTLNVSDSWSLIAREFWNRIDAAGRIHSSNDLLLGWAFRPVHHDALQALISVRSVTAARALELPDVSARRTLARFETTLDLSARYTLLGGYMARVAEATTENVTASTFTGISHLRLIYEIGNHWDFSSGVRHRRRSASRGEWSYGGELGYLLTTDLWIVSGFNFVGFADRDLPTDIHSGAAGYVSVRFKFDERFLGGGLTPDRVFDRRVGH